MPEKGMIAFKYSASAATRSMPTYDDGTCNTLTSDWHSPAVAYPVPNVVLKLRHTGSPNVGGGEGALWGEEVSFTLATRQDQTLFDGTEGGYVVRRLTPLECERLQGMPDNHTDVPWKGKDHAPDSKRYKAIGNSFAVPVVRWIGERIEMVQGIIDGKEM